MSARLNVVMLARDRHRLTEQAVNSMYKNRTQDFDLTIVDDASDIPVSQWFHASQGHVIRNEVSAGTGAARNQGIASARRMFGDCGLLYLSDNDVYFEPGWDAVLLAAHATFPNVKIIGGGCHPFMQPAPQRHSFLGGAGSLQLIYRMTYRDAISGYSWLLDWETWDRFGPLDANAPGVRQGEDWAMSQRVVQGGYAVGSVLPEVVLHCGVTDTFGERPPGWELIERSRKEGIIYE